jgi:hypothetical protein
MTKRSKVTVEEVVEMAGHLPAKDRLRVISKLAEGLTREAPTKRPRKPITQYAFVGMWKDREELFMASKTTPRNDEKKIRQRIKSAN